MKKIISHSLLLIIAFAAVSLFKTCNTANTNNKKSNENTNPPAQSLLIFAAASLTNVLSEIADSFEIKNDVRIKINLASSGTLARQIEQGAAPDIYISASRQWADYIDSLGYFTEAYSSEIARNDLVLIAPLNSELQVPLIDSSLSFMSLVGSGRLSIGDPAHVPAGRYARQSLEYFGWYKQLENKILPAKDARSALMVIELGEAPLGIVYRTDAEASGKVQILNSFPENSHETIIYIAGVCSNKKIAKDFFAYLNSNELKAVWKKYSFTV
jgi:molybdate transport system substrate-binding protein